MKLALALGSVLVLGAHCGAQSPTVATADIKTLDGHVYKNARPLHIDPDGVSFVFSGGIVKIYFAELPEDVRKQYGYDPAKAEAFVRAQADAATAAQKALDDAQKKSNNNTEYTWPIIRRRTFRRRRRRGLRERGQLGKSRLTSPLSLGEPF